MKQTLLVVFALCFLIAVCAVIVNTPTYQHEAIHAVQR